MFIEEDFILDKLIDNEFKLSKELMFINYFEIDTQIDVILTLYNNRQLDNLDNLNTIHLDVKSNKNYYSPSATLTLKSIFNRCDIRFYQNDYKKNYENIAIVVRDNIIVLGIRKYIEILQNIKCLKTQITELKSLVTEEKYDFIIHNYRKGEMVFKEDESIQVLLTEINDFK